MSDTPDPDDLLRVDDLRVTHRPQRAGGLTVPAVQGVSFTIRRGETVGLVGESGSGKSTIARAIMRLVKPDSGTADLDGIDVLQARGRELKDLRKRIQMVFQDPYSSLDPTRTIGNSVTEPLRIHHTVSRGNERETLVELLASVGIPEEARDRYPEEFSGGQRQRIAIARALAPGPDLVVLDEAVSALDVSTRNVILKLLHELRQSRGLSYLFISHDLTIVRLLAQRVVVLYLGRVLEQGSTAEVLMSPSHPYTEALLASSLVPDPVVQRERTKIILAGDVPSPTHPPTGCVFHPRCPYATAKCAVEVPVLEPNATGGSVACHYPLTTTKVALPVPAVR